VDELDKQFIQPDTIRVLDLELRPFSAGTELLLDQMRAALKRRLKELFEDNPDEDYRKRLSGYYYVGMFLFVHNSAIPLNDMRVLCFSPEKFFERFFEFLDRYQRDDIISADSTVDKMITSARAAKKWTVEPDGLENPNSLGRVGSPVTSAV
jgi:hypothetical protein